MTTSFTLTDPKAVMIQGKINPPGGGAPTPGSPYYLFVKVGSYWKVIGVYIGPTSGGSNYTNEFEVTAVLPGGNVTYTIASDAGATQLRWGEAGGAPWVLPVTFLVSV